MFEKRGVQGHIEHTNAGKENIKKGASKGPVSNEYSSAFHPVQPAGWNVNRSAYNPYTNDTMNCVASFFSPMTPPYDPRSLS